MQELIHLERIVVGDPVVMQVAANRIERDLVLAALERVVVAVQQELEAEDVQRGNDVALVRLEVARGIEDALRMRIDRCRFDVVRFRGCSGI
jgi:hypothetical protein